MELQQKVQDTTDPDFVWQDYLEDTKAKSAPNEAFTHVEHSLESIFKVGMQLEVPNPEVKDCYWRASIVMICGELLSLRYAGFGDDRSCDFWLNIKSGEFHHVGWCRTNSKKLYPPKVVLDRHPDLDALLESELRKVETIPALVSQDHLAACIPIEQIKCGMKVEISDDYNPEHIWIATILQNFGGRLLLRYDGLDSDCSSYDFWMFYLCDRLYYVGYAAENNLKYCAPAAVKDKHSENEWDEILQKSLNYSGQPFPAHVLEPKNPLEEHSFVEGMKLEAVDPRTYCHICPATVSKVINSFYFLVTIDAYSMDESVESILCCNSNEQLIFPINWAEENGLDLTIPKGYDVKDSKFVWDDYLNFCNAVAAPSDLFTMFCMNTGFEEGMKLEAVDPVHPSNIYAATVEKIVEPIMFLSFDKEVAPKSLKITGVNSLDIYPVGWCDTNGYPLQTPPYQSKHKSSAVPNAVEKSDKPATAELKPQTEQQAKSWCPKIHFNHRCFTGPLLSKSRLAELPKAIGPGPVHLVMNEVISRVVNIAYKSSRVLQLLQVHGKPSPGMQQQVVKAKYKGKSYRATIEVVQHSGQVEEFCKKICSKLECCPYLFGPTLFEDACPSNCYTQTKTKFGYNFVKKHKKPGRPPLASTSTSESTVETVRRGPGRKKKRKHWTQLLSQAENNLKETLSKREESSAAEEETVFKSENETPTNKTPENETSARLPKGNLINKKKLKHIPSSSIVTRGAKLPNFGLWHHVSSFHSRRGRPRTRPIRPFPRRKVGRPLGSTKKAIALKKESEDDDTISSTFKEEAKPAPRVSFLKSNPNEWSVEEVEKFIQGTDCAPVAPLLKEQEIDGQALLMLDIVTVQEFLNLKPEPATKFCLLLTRIKYEFLSFYVHKV